MKLDQMTDSEKQALGALVRVIVGVDGEYSAAEVARLQKTAEYLGEDEFWRLVNDSGHRHLDQDVLDRLAGAVERPEAREAIYGVLFGIAAAGTVVGDEGKLLDWLSGAWQLETGASGVTGSDHRG